jgi:hypothetical protein
MDLSKLIGWAIPLLLIAPLTYAAEERDWKQGSLISVHTLLPHYQVANETRYQYVVCDEDYSYTVVFKRPLRTGIRDRLKFVIDGDNLIVLDPNGNECPAPITKREPSPFESYGSRL